MPKDYKDTLNLPQTDFPMKANLTQKEPYILKFLGREQGSMGSSRKRRKNSRHYILHDGPPYANGHIHIGHALNKILKDIIVKYKSMKGFYSPYVPGWDCHGLPIELQVDKNLGDKKDKLRCPRKEKALQGICGRIRRDPERGIQKARGIRRLAESLSYHV